MNMIKLLVQTLIALILIGTTVSAVQATVYMEYNTYEALIKEDGSVQYTNVPVNNYGVLGYVCADPSCNSFSSMLYGGSSISSGNDNNVQVTLPTQLQSPWGYGHVLHKEDYITWEQNPDFAGSNTPSTPVIMPTSYLGKVEVCRSPVDSFVVVNDAAPNEPVQFDVSTSLDATVYAAILNAGPIGFTPPQIPENYEVTTTVQITVRDQSNNIVYTESRTEQVAFGDQMRVMFEYTPVQVGRYTATVTTSVPDGKCLDDVSASSQKEFSVIGDTTELCYALANNLQVSPLNQVAGEPTTISFETLANAYDEFGALSPLPIDIRYDITKSGFVDVIETTIPASSNVVDFRQVTQSYTFPEEGIYDVQVTAKADACPYPDSTFDVISVEYEVESGAPTNTPPTFIVPDVFLEATDGFMNNILNVVDFASDPDQPADTLHFALIEQSDASVANCVLDGARNLDCTVLQPGTNVLRLTATDDEDATTTDFVTVTVTQVPQCRDGVDNDGDGHIDLDDPGCAFANDDDESDDPVIPQCSDGIDNDNDGLVDLMDPGCSSPDDDNEADGTTQCQDGVDNDGDGLIDLADPGCSSPLDNDESDGTSQCQDGIDNDGDGLVDFPADPGCFTPQDNDESDGTSQCQDGIDNDGDGLTDLADPGCSSPQDDDESDGTSQCQDGIDNDGDGLVDFPADPGCSSAQDNDEFNVPVTPQCSDGIDNDGDGLVDLNDPGCSSPNDDDESDGTSQCQDGIDNDGDGLVDFPADPGCTTPQDNTEQGATQCVDSDGGVDFFTRGTTQVAEDGSVLQSQTDSCLANDLTEYFCNGLTIGSTSTSCAFGCQAGACLPQPKQCSDGIDNDGDGLTDLADPGCSGPDDDDESDGTSQCQDGFDNDGDGLVDLNDPGCSSPQDNDESDGTSQCQDGIDNDGDGLVDWPLDPGCMSAQDNDEDGALSCTDSDGGNVPTLKGTLRLFEDSTQIYTGFDFCVDQNTLFEFACTGNEMFVNGNPFNVGVQVSCAFGCNDGACQEAPQVGSCNDGIDNDGDGLVDWPADPGCHSPVDTDEQDRPDQNALLMTQIRVDSAEDFKAGYGGTVSMYLNNVGDNDFDNVRVQVFLLETGDKGSAGPFDVNNQKRAVVYIPTYEALEPGVYTARISLWSDNIKRVKHRELIIN